MKELFIKYFDGEISSSEEKTLWAFVRQSPENTKEFREAESIWRKSHAPSIWMERDYSSVVRDIRKKRNRIIYSRITAVAASIIAVAFISYYSLRDRTFSYEALAGSVKEYVLPDGSSVSLNAGSSIQYTSGRLSKNRQVSLSGEAYFDVVSDKAHPFVVNTEDFSIVVLGTKFMVSDYPEDKQSQVVLTEGSISLHIGCESMTMAPGDRVVCDGETFYESKVDSIQVCQWTSDIISYDDIELGDFVNRLAREFNMDIVLEAKGFAHESFRASFSRNDTIDSILGTVCNIFPLSVKKTGKTYSLIFTKTN